MGSNPGIRAEGPSSPWSAKLLSCFVAHKNVVLCAWVGNVCNFISLSSTVFMHNIWWQSKSALLLFYGAGVSKCFMTKCHNGFIVLQINPTRCTILLSIFISLLYMFRTTMCPSSGEITVSMRHWHLSLCMGGFWSAEQTPPIKSGKHQCRVDTVISPDDGHMVARNV